MDTGNHYRGQEHHPEDFDTGFFDGGDPAACTRDISPLPEGTVAAYFYDPDASRWYDSSETVGAQEDIHRPADMTLPTDTSSTTFFGPRWSDDADVGEVIRSIEVTRSITVTPGPGESMDVRYVSPDFELTIPSGDIQDPADKGLSRVYVNTGSAAVRSAAPGLFGLVRGAVSSLLRRDHKPDGPSKQQ